MVHPDGSELTRITMRPGIDKEPAFSPDGGWLAFTSDRSGSLQIHLLELATGAVTQVTNHEGDADQASFSHDGQLLAFHSGASTFTINVDGTNEQLIASGPDPLNGYAHPQFTPDDTRVVVDRNNEIDVFTLATKEQRQIVQNWTTTIEMPSLSPSGIDVVYSVYCDGKGLWSSPYSVNTNPCEGVRITPAGEIGFESEHPSWGPDDFIAYARVDTSASVGQIALILRDRGATPCAVTEAGDDNRNPSFYVP
jgi:Tol biopolymer transport system component